MEFRPYSYQKEAMDFLLDRERAVLVMEEGLGTLVITLSVLHKRKKENGEERTLIVTAAGGIAEKWLSELKKWDHLKEMEFSVICGSEIQKRKAFQKEAGIYFVSYDNLAWIHKNDIWKFHNMVIDDLTAYKNEKTKRFQVMMAVRGYADRIIGITSFPSQDQLSDLWGEIKVIDGGKRLGESRAGFFERYYFTNYVWNGETTTYYRELKKGAVKSVWNKLSDICFVPDPAQYPDMPQVIFQNYILELDLRERSKYRYMKNGLFSMPGEPEEEIQDDATVTKLMQMTNGIVCDGQGNVQIFHSKKLDALKNIITGIQGNILAVYWFIHDKEIICKRYPEARTLETYKDFKDWNEGKIRLGLLHPAAGGMRKLFRGGNHLVWFSVPWSAALYKRTICRMQSVSGEHTLIVTHLIVKDTMDEIIINRLEKKMGSLDLLAGGRKGKEI